MNPHDVSWKGQEEFKTSDVMLVLLFILFMFALGDLVIYFLGV